MIWITLHSETGVRTRINVSHILRYNGVNFKNFGQGHTDHEGSSLVMTDEGQIFMKETPEQIDDMISKAMG